MFNSHSLRFKINIAIVVTFVVISIIFSVLLTVFELQRRADAMKQATVVLEEMVQHNNNQLGNEIFAGHARAVTITLEDMTKRDNVLVAVAYDEYGAFFSSTEEDDSAPDLPEKQLHALQTGPVHQETTWDGHSVLVYTGTLNVYGEDIGYVRLYYSLSSLNRETWHIVAIFSGLLLTFLVLMAGLLNIMMTRLVLHPVYMLKNAMLQVINAGKSKEADGGATASGERTAGIREMILAFDHIYSKFQVNYESKDAIGALAQSFRHMVGALRTSYLELQQAEEKYHGIFENAQEGLFQLDLQGGILSANTAMAKLWGFATEEDMVASIRNFGQQCFACPDDLERVLRLVREQGHVAGVELEFKGRDGQCFWGSMALHFVAGAQGALLYYEGSIVDITERLEKERAQNAREVAEASVRARREIMDNSGQGFLSFGPDLLVEEEYSLECEHIFDAKDIAGKAIDSLLFAYASRERKDFANNLVRILNEKKRNRKRLYLSLMPREILLDDHHDDRHIKVTYRLLSGQRMMLILSDVTKQRALESAVELERRRLAFIVSAMKNREQIFDSLDDLIRLFQDIQHISQTPEERFEDVLHECYRRIHTAKGNCALLDFVHLPQELHAVESRLSDLLESGNGIKERFAATVDTQKLEEAAGKDCTMIREALGVGYFEGRGDLTIPADKVEALVGLGDMILERYGDSIDARTAELVRELQQIRYVEYSSLLEMYPRLVQQLAERLDKEVSLFQIEGPSIRVDPDRFGPFTRSLVHVFRNAVDHGIETPDQRLEAGKEVAGKVTCRLDVHDGTVEIVITDDGKGIDLKTLQEKAAEMGIAEVLDDPMLVIFMDGISSRMHASELSGRGVGLAAVKSSVDALGGKIAVASERGKGTSIRISLPSV